jgi:uncharacterized protein YdeI (YjbR/CyaY-like superfamily)
MSGAAENLPRVEVTSRAELRDWLEHNHARDGSIWLMTYKRSAGDRYLSYDAIVQEALAYGWIDSLPRALDECRTMRLLSPRKPGSAWSKVNKRHVERLIAAGAMTSTGLGVVERAKADGSWNKLDAVEALEEPQDLADALDARPSARAHFDTFPRSSKRLILEWIGQAKRPETRAARVTETASLAALGKRANHYRQPKKETQP